MGENSAQRAPAGYVGIEAALFFPVGRPAGVVGFQTGDASMQAQAASVIVLGDGVLVDAGEELRYRRQALRRQAVAVRLGFFRCGQFFSGEPF